MYENEVIEGWRSGTGNGRPFGIYKIDDEEDD